MDWPTDIGTLSPSAPRTTKLYTIILFLCVYTNFTFAQEIAVHAQEWAYRLDNAPPSSKRSTFHDEDPNDELYITPLHVDIGIETDNFVNDGNSTRTYVLSQQRQQQRPSHQIPRTQLLTSRSHEHKLVMGIAQDLFFYPTDFNWYDADPTTYLLQWSVESRAKYEKKLQEHPGLQDFEFFVEDVTGWTDTQCPSDYSGTCTGLPPDEYVQRKIPLSRHQARRQLYAMEAHRLGLEQGKFVIQVINTAKERLDG